MIAVDTNILLHADREEMPLHDLALRAIRRLAEGREACVRGDETHLMVRASVACIGGRMEGAIPASVHIRSVQG